jgi:hypothetical protein
MRRQVVAVIIGAVAVIYAVFDDRVSLRDPGVKSQVK